MTAESITNNAVSSLAANLSSSGTSLTLHSGDGSKFPSSTFRLTLGDPHTAGAFEVVLVGTRTGDNCTSVTRGVEGTQQAWPISTVVQNALTAGAINAIATAVDGKLSNDGGKLTTDGAGQVTSTLSTSNKPAWLGILSAIPAALQTVFGARVSGDSGSRAALGIRSDGYGNVRLGNITNNSDLYAQSDGLHASATLGSDIALSGSTKAFARWVATDGKTFEMRIDTSGNCILYNATDSLAVATFSAAGALALLTTLAATGASLSDTTAGALHLQFTGAASDPANAGTTPAIRRSSAGILDIIGGALGLRLIKNQSVGYGGIWQVDNNGNMAIIGSVAAASGVPGTPVLVAKATATVTTTGTTAVLTYAPAADGMYLLCIWFRTNNGSPPKAVTATFTYNDLVANAARTGSFPVTFGTGGVISASGSSLSAGNDAWSGATMLIAAKSGTNIVINYSSAAGGTPNDTVKAAILFLGNW